MACSVVNGKLDLRLGQKVHDVFGAAIEFRMAALATEALDLRNRDALDADFGNGLTYVVQLERLDNRRNHLHCLIPLGINGRPKPPG